LLDAAAVCILTQRQLPRNEGDEVMRLTILAFVVVTGLIIDQVRFYGYYRRETVNTVEKGVARIAIWFR
jgi:hypothetical protein